MAAAFGIGAGLLGLEHGSSKSGKAAPSLARLWPWLLVAYLAWAAGSWIVGAISNDVMPQLTPAVLAATPFVLALILPSALAHDSQESQAAQQPESAPPNRRDEHVEVRHGQD